MVGAGNIAQNIHLPLLAKMPNVKLLALCDKNLSKAKLIAEKYGIPHVCRNVEELERFEGIRAVDICTSTDAHFEAAMACLDMGYDVLVEKPLARTKKEAEQLVTASEKNDRKLMVGMNHRFRPDTALMKNYIDKVSWATCTT